MNYLKKTIRKLAPKKDLSRPKNTLSYFPNASILEPVSIEDRDSDSHTLSENPMWEYFIKNTSGDIFKWHHYFEIYHMFFNRFRQKKNVQILEIGVKKGGSLNLWRNYFDESTIIVGVDIKANCQKFENRDLKIFVRIGDQADPKFLKKLVDEFGKFDIIIDDGGHTANQQITSFLHLYESLSENGIYLVEDTHTSYWEKYQDRKDSLSFIDFSKSLVDYLHDPYHRVSGFSPRADKPNKSNKIQVSKFYSMTKSICFFDSIIVYTKGKRVFPKAEKR